MEDEKLTELLINAIRSEDFSPEKIAVTLKEEARDAKSVISVLWTLLGLSKTCPEILGSNGQNNVYQITKKYTEITPEAWNFIFFSFDIADIIKIDKAISSLFRKEIAQSAAILSKIELSTTFSENPEGFSRLIVALYTNQHPKNLEEIIGEERIDPIAILELIFDILEQKFDCHVAAKLAAFPPATVLKVYIALVRHSRCHVSQKMIDFLKENLALNESQKIFVGSLLSEETQMRFKECERIIRELSKEYQKNKVPRLPGEPKAETQQVLSLKARYKIALDELKRTPAFKAAIEAESDEDFIQNISKIAQYDPCEIPELSERLLSIIQKRMNDDFHDWELLCILGCHNDDSALLVRVTKLKDIPPHVISFYLLPVLTKSCVGWQLAEFVWDNVLVKYTAGQRLSIYKKFFEYQRTSRRAILNVAITSQKLKYMAKRLSIRNAEIYASKYMRYFLRAPSYASTTLFNYICFITPITKVPEILIGQLPSVSIDMLFWSLMSAVDNDKVTSGLDGKKNVSDWPQDLATFFGRILALHPDSLIVQSYILRIRNGLVRHKPKYACLLTALLKEMCALEYKGNLTKEEKELRSGKNLQKLKKRADSLDSSEFTMRMFGVSNVFSKGTMALDILSCLDTMSTECIGGQDIVDQIRFLFISVCDIASVQNKTYTPKELMGKGLSKVSSYHVARIGHKYDQYDDFFDLFWSNTVAEFHVPQEAFNSTIKEVEEKLSKLSQNEQEYTGLSLIVNKIKVEYKQQLKNVAEMKEIMKMEGNSWFSQEQPYERFVRECILPRCVFSFIDSWYCSLYVKSLSDNCEKFNSKLFTEELISRLHFVIFSSTYEESCALGRFVSKLLKITKDIPETNTIQNQLTTKIILLLNREESFVIANTLAFLASCVKYFPLIEEDKKTVVGLIEALNPPEGSRNVLLRKMYLQNLEKSRTEKKEKPKPAPKVEAVIKPVNSPVISPVTVAAVQPKVEPVILRSSSQSTVRFASRAELIEREKQRRGIEDYGRLRTDQYRRDDEYQRYPIDQYSPRMPMRNSSTPILTRDNPPILRDTRTPTYLPRDDLMHQREDLARPRSRDDWRQLQLQLPPPPPPRNDYPPLPPPPPPPPRNDYPPLSLQREERPRPILRVTSRDDIRYISHDDPRRPIDDRDRRYYDRDYR